MVPLENAGAYDLVTTGAIVVVIVVFSTLPVLKDSAAPEFMPGPKTKNEKINVAIIALTSIIAVYLFPIISPIIHNLIER